MLVIFGQFRGEFRGKFRGVFSWVFNFRPVFGPIFGPSCGFGLFGLSLAMELIDQIALTLCGYGLPGEPCGEPCVFCLGQAEEIMKVINGYSENKEAESRASEQLQA